MESESYFKEKEPQPLDKPIFNPEQTERIKIRTEELIETILDSDIGVVIFLDRSARPLSWMLRSAWEANRPDTTIPKIKFVNIGREKGELTHYDSWGPSEYQYDSEEEWEAAAKEFWSKFDSEKYVASVRRDLELDESDRKNSPQNRRILLVDDFSGSGFTQELSIRFFQRHFPELPVYFYAFFKRGDEKTFAKAGWNGTHLPWNTDKSYTLLSEEDAPEKVVAKPELDPEKRKNGILLKKEIKRIFSISNNITMPHEAESGPQEQKEALYALIKERVMQYFEELDVHDIAYKTEQNGVHFFVHLPEEHMDERREQMKSLGGYLPPTQFYKEKILPFRKRWEQEYSGYLDCTFLSKDVSSDTLEFVISEKKN